VNADSDPEGEVLVSGWERLTLCDHQGMEIWARSYPAYTGGAVAAAADFDGDGAQEFAVAFDGELRVVDGDGHDLWSLPLTSEYLCAGPVSWDIDLDGAPEVIYGDGETLWIVDGARGLVRVVMEDYSSLTLTETPSVADVDGDGHGEILIGSNTGIHGSTDLGLYVLGSEDGDWPWARPTYNQHAYWGGNVGDDLSIPTDTTPSWLSSENLLRGQAPAWYTSELPNLRAAVTGACVATCQPGGFAQVAVQVWNDGSVEAPAGTGVRLYGNPGGSPQPIEERTLEEALPPAHSLEWTVETSVDALGSELRVVVDVHGAVEECAEDDNEGAWMNPWCQP
jgi:hypothetical protein